MPDLTYEKRRHIAYITYNRPDRANAVTPEMIIRLAEAWEDIRDDSNIRVAILTGAGKRVFTAGADLARLVPLLSGARAPEDDWDERLLANPGLHAQALLRGFDLYKPVIAAINGHAIGGGTEIVQAADIRLAVPGATFGLTEVGVGILPSGGSLVRLPRQIPYCSAMELLLTGRPIPAEEALRIGLINKIVPAEKLMAEAEELARVIAGNAPVAVQKTKEAVLRTSGMELSHAFALEREYEACVLQTEDAREGAGAFFEKRRPNFKGV